jgi:hypothetical protein
LRPDQRRTVLLILSHVDCIGYLHLAAVGIDRGIILLEFNFKHWDTKDTRLGDLRPVPILRVAGFHGHPVGS